LTDPTAKQHGTADDGVVDVHNHVIPGVDDGAQDESDTGAALDAMYAEGVSSLIATPHIELGLLARGGMDFRLETLDAGWAVLARRAERSCIRVYRGAELRLDTPTPDLSDARLRLAGGPFVLVEFPYFIVPPRSPRIMAWLVAQGWHPVLAHPERYAGVDGGLEVVAEWRDAGARLQLNGGSLLGRYGETARRLAAILLAHGWVDYLSSDYHARGAPRIAEYRDVLTSNGGRAQADLLMQTNPRRILSGEPPLAVPPLDLDATDPRAP
jgi:protein-tyrosine phosphatase